MSQNKLLLLGIARRAGRLFLGNDPALEAMRNGQTCVIFGSKMIYQNEH